MASPTVRFSVPQGELPNLKLLAHADASALQDIEEALKQEKPTLDVDALSRAVAQRIGLDASLPPPLVSLLWRLALVQRRCELTAEAFVEALTVTLGDFGSDQWSVDDKTSWGAHRDWLSRVLHSHGVLALGAKAAELMLEQRLVFFKSRVITDVRPLFDDAAEQLIGFVPVHTLAITCYEDGESRTVRVAMDSEDLGQLRRQLERAQRKGDIITRDLAEADLMVVGTGASENG